MIVIPNVGKAVLLSYMLGKLAPPVSVRYHWYLTNTAPGDTTVLADFVEAAPSQMGPTDVASTTWSLAVVGNVAIATAPGRTLLAGAAVTLYGYYVTPTADPLSLLWCEQFSPSPLVFSASGVGLFFTPRITMFTCNPAGLYFEALYW